MRHVLIFAQHENISFFFYYFFIFSFFLLGGGVRHCYVQIFLLIHKGELESLTYDALIVYVPVNICFSHVRTGLPGLNQYIAEDKATYSRTQRILLKDTAQSPQ